MRQGVNEVLEVLFQTRVRRFHQVSKREKTVFEITSPTKKIV